MTHVTCRLTVKNRDQLRNPTLGNRVWATFTFFQCPCGVLHADLFVLVEEDGELADGDAQVSLVELVRYVPADRSELAPLLDQRVEEAEAEQQLLPRRLVRDAREKLAVRDRVAEVRAEQVEPQTCSVTAE